MSTAYGWGYQKERARMLAEGGPCVHQPCDELATTIDHQPPLSMHHHVEGSGCCDLFLSCKSHMHQQGGQLGRKAQLAAQEAPEVEPEPVGIGPEDPRWHVDWMTDLLEVPDDASWPRFATLPHPAAVGSYGVDVEAESWIDLRWWQRFWLRLLLLHDGRRLLMVTAIVTAWRLVGKTVGLRELAWWRMNAGDLFGERQAVVHTGNKLGPALDAIVGRIEDPDLGDEYRTRKPSGRAEIIAPDRSTWRALSPHATNGQTASLAMCDEAWDLDAEVVEDNIAPTTDAPLSSQLTFFSSSNTGAKGMMIGRRADALEHLDDPEYGTLIVEWSAPRDCDPSDIEVLRRSSPYWGADDDRLMVKRYAEAVSLGRVEAFKAERLNVWPARALTSLGGGDLLVEPSRWADLATDLDDHVFVDAVIALEDFHGLGVGAVGAGITEDGTVVASASSFESRVEAFAWLASTSQVGVSMVLAGITLAQDPALRGMSTIKGVGGSETKLALPLIRSMCRDGTLLHVADSALDGQVADLRVKPTTAQQLTIVSRQRSDLIRCAGWAAQHLVAATGAQPGVS